MKEFEIRPADLFEEYLRLSARDVLQYFADPEKRIHRDCPGCGQDSARPVFVKNQFQCVECRECHTLYVNPCPSPKQLAEFYQSSPSQKYWARTFYPSVADARRNKIFRPRAEKIKSLFRQHMFESGLIVDVGAGAGTMLEELRLCETGEDFLAVEPTPDMAEICRQLDLKVFEGFADEASKHDELVGKAALTLSFEVIEHVISPKDFFTDLKMLCKPGGLILVTGLCGSGFDIKILGEHSKAVTPPHHLNFLSRNGVSRLLERCGLEEVSFSTPGVLDVDIVRNHFKKEPDAITDNFVSYLLKQDDASVLSNLQCFITDNNLSSHMWILARNPAL